MSNFNNLNNEKYEYDGNVENILKHHCTRLDQKHPLERKINFLLDIRGYIKVNNIMGSYAEFGCFKAETMYCAYNILEPTGLVKNYVGLDTFKGEPRMSVKESNEMPYVQEGSFSSRLSDVKTFVDRSIGVKSRLIEGDFRKKEVIEMCDQYTPISIAVIDCNIISSIEASLKYVLKNITPGGIIFIDDFYTSLANGNAIIDEIVVNSFNTSKHKFINHGFYPPFGRSFIAARRN